jgi:UDP-glucose-4-epimerase GalE
VILDNLMAGHREAVRGLPLIQGDIGDASVIRDVIRQHCVTAVMHFAAFLDVGESVRIPARYYWNNVVNTLSLLDAMVQEKVPHFVFSSTAAVYGNPIETPISETHPTRPINAYGETKLAVERALPHYERAYGLRSICLRYFNASGADASGEIGEDHRPEIHLIPRAIAATTGGPSLEIYGDNYATNDGTCVRDYVHVSDLGNSHVRALGVLEAGAGSAVYNIGSGRPCSVREVVETVARVTGRPVPHTMSARREGDPAVLFASSQLARTALNWQPQYEDLKVIVETAWLWHRTHPRGYASMART